MKHRLLILGLALFCLGCDTGEKRIAVFLYDQSDPFVEGINLSMKEQFKGTLYKQTTYDGHNSQVIQNEQLEQMLVHPVDLVILNPVDRLGAHAVIRKMKEENIPVIFFNREPLAEDLSLWEQCFYVGAKAEQSGQLQGKLIMKLFGEDPAALNRYDRNGDNKIQGVIIRGEQGHQDSEIRTSELSRTLTSAGFSFDLLTSTVANWKRKEAYDNMEEILVLHRDELEVVISNNDEMALGAIEQMRKQGLFGDQNGNGRVDRADEDWLPVVGIDGLPEALNSIEQGYLYGTVINDSEKQAQAIVNLSGMILAGQNLQEGSFTLSEGTYIWTDYYPYLWE